jgi:hypothetical protein
LHGEKNQSTQHVDAFFLRKFTPKNLFVSVAVIIQELSSANQKSGGMGRRAAKGKVAILCYSFSSFRQFRVSTFPASHQSYINRCHTKI